MPYLAKSISPNSSMDSKIEKKMDIKNTVEKLNIWYNYIGVTQDKCIGGWYRQNTEVLMVLEISLKEEFHLKLDYLLN